MPHKFDGIILMGPFGSGKSYLGRRLNELGIARYVDLEPIVYDRFADGDDFDLDAATDFIRNHYHQQLSSGDGAAAFESTGVVQRPLLLDMMAQYEIALVRVCTPGDTCLERVRLRNVAAIRPIIMENAENFFDYWTNEIAPTWTFMLEVDGTDEATAINKIRSLLSC